MERMEDLDFAQVGGRVRVTRGFVGRHEAVDVRVDDHRAEREVGLFILASAPDIGKTRGACDRGPS
jgi:hypothetical protein